MLPVGIAVLLPAQRAGNVMHHGGKFQDLLRVSVQSFQFPDGLCHRPDLEKVVDIVVVSLVKRNHLLNRS